jgi:mercuric ion binding protein
MKTQIIIALVAFTTLFSACKQNSLNKESSFWVRGNCDMCKERIEKTVRAIPGVGMAAWDVESGMLKVNYDSTVVKEQALQEAVAGSGHATKMVPMNQKAHDALPECCQVGGMMGEQPAAVDSSATSCCSEAGGCSTHKDGKSCCSDKGVCSMDHKSCKDATGMCMSEGDKCCHKSAGTSCCVKDGNCATSHSGASCCTKGVCSKDGNSCTSAKGKCQTNAGCCS